MTSDFGWGPIPGETPIDEISGLLVKVIVSRGVVNRKRTQPARSREHCDVRSPAKRLSCFETRLCKRDIQKRLVVEIALSRRPVRRLGGRWPSSRRMVSTAGAAILQPVGWPPRPSRPTNSPKANAPREAGPFVLKNVFPASAQIYRQKTEQVHYS
jgi:hypothetical protein